MKKQTAVEWFVDQLSSYTTTDGNIISHHQNITHLFEQAKEMEKEQIIESYCQGCFDISKDESIFPRETSEQYYNQTFKSE